MFFFYCIVYTFLIKTQFSLLYRSTSIVNKILSVHLYLNLSRKLQYKNVLKLIIYIYIIKYLSLYII